MPEPWSGPKFQAWMHQEHPKPLCSTLRPSEWRVQQKIENAGGVAVDFVDSARGVGRPRAPGREQSEANKIAKKCFEGDETLLVWSD